MSVNNKKDDEITANPKHYFFYARLRAKWATAAMGRLRAIENCQSNAHLVQKAHSVNLVRRRCFSHCMVVGVSRQALGRWTCTVPALAIKRPPFPLGCPSREPYGICLPHAQSAYRDCFLNEPYTLAYRPRTPTMA